MLIDPLALRGRQAPSRVMFGPHETNLGRARAISERHLAYYLRRAQGGAGLIVTETASVHESDWPYERAPLAADCGAGWTALARACRPYGTLVLASLGHAGLQGSSAYSQRALWAPSRVPDAGTRELPMEMAAPEFEQLVRGFAAGARRAAGSGLDGVEINAGQFSLLRQFHSGLTNLRGDDYGTDRLLLTERVLAAVRAALGEGRVLGLRLCCDELAPWAGVTPELAAGQAGRLAGLVDYLAVVRGSSYSVAATRPDLHTEPGINVQLCHGIREVIGARVPVVLQGSVIDPDLAGLALAGRAADLVEMTRALIADPDLVAHVRRGHHERARPCVLCNQNCMVRDHRNPIVSCLLEPGSGYETTDLPLDPPPPLPPSGPAGPAPGDGGEAVDVLIVGAGPAGMEAARVLAGRGVRVRLAERAAEPGGMLATAALVHGRSRLRTAIDWWRRELDRLGVRIDCGTRITESDLDEARAAGRPVLLATGSVPGPRGYTVHDGATVTEAADLLSLVRQRKLRRLPVGPIAVFDPVGGPIGVGIAELLAAKGGRQVSIVTQDQIAGTQLARTGDLAEANARLQRAGVVRELRSVLHEVTAVDIVLADRFTGRVRRVACASIVHCGHRLPDETLYRTRPGTPRAGDCVAPRTVHEAVREAREAALALLAGRPATVGPARASLPAGTAGTAATATAATAGIGR